MRLAAVNAQICSPVNSLELDSDLFKDIPPITAFSKNLFSSHRDVNQRASLCGFVVFVDRLDTSGKAELGLSAVNRRHPGMRCQLVRRHSRKEPQTRVPRAVEVVSG